MATKHDGVLYSLLVIIVAFLLMGFGAHFEAKWVPMFTSTNIKANLERIEVTNAISGAKVSEWLWGGEGDPSYQKACTSKMPFVKNADKWCNDRFIAVCCSYAGFITAFMAIVLSAVALCKPEIPVCFSGIITFFHICTFALWAGGPVIYMAFVKDDMQKDTYGANNAVVVNSNSGNFGFGYYFCIGAAALEALTSIFLIYWFCFVSFEPPLLWEECTASDGRTYWYNTETAESTWKNPYAVDEYIEETVVQEMPMSQPDEGRACC